MDSPHKPNYPSRWPAQNQRHDLNDGLEGQCVSTPPEQRTQAERVIARFGGHRRLFNAMNLAYDMGLAKKPRSITQIYRWTYPKAQGGSDGLIPTAALRDVLAAARVEGIVITPEDLFPVRR